MIVKIFSKPIISSKRWRERKFSNEKQKLYKIIVEKEVEENNSTGDYIELIL